ncbi:autotransporter domain-containing protein [Caballeronia sp. dw_19]|uniref:autotransporter domain-containing protein n=1 Tax=Caballeronia sp. dw_19 TaxID=2719791 RepID=UPI001BD3CBB8|nr:autotransporter domain-containing protein [Caballeronia sp. dw_19]
MVGKANATDLGSSATGYVLTPAGNPYNVIAGAYIDTSTQSSDAIYGDIDHDGPWTLTNNGSVIGGHFPIQFDSPAVIVNNGSVITQSSTAIALYDGGNVTNSAGASIVGHLDGVFANNSDSSVTNGGDIGGSALDITKAQSGVHLPSGGTVINLATGRIAGYGPAILANSATTVQNAGVILSANGTGIDLTEGTAGVGSVVYNSGSITGADGTAILFGPENNTLILAGTSAITGIVDASAHGVSTTNTLILGGTGSGRFDISSLGATEQYRGFDILQKNDSGIWTFTGTNGAAQTWLVSGGGVEMAGRLTGSVIATPGATGIDIEVVSGGMIIASSGNAVSVNDSSRVINSGLISSSADGAAAVIANGAGTSVVNAGSIAAMGSAAGIAINASTGAASLTNEQGGSITSAAGNAVQAGSNVSILNSGSIAATGGSGAGITIDASTGPTTLLNKQGGSINSAAGVAVQAGSNVSITNAGSIAAEGANGTGVMIDALTGSSSLTNELGGSIASAAGNAVQAGSNVSIVNAGSIVATGGSGAGMTIDASTGPTTLLNKQGGSIKSAAGVAVQAGSNVSITNAGTIATEGQNGTGVMIDALTGAASLTNEPGGSITSAGGAAVQASSNVSVYNAGTLAGNSAAVSFTGSNNRLTLDSGSQVSGDLDGGNGSANALVLQGSGTLSSRTYGFSTLAMQGADWTVSSSVQVGSSSVIESGTLRLKGTLTSPAITVAPGATLTGTGTLNGALMVQGVIAPGVTGTAATTTVLQPLAIGTLSVIGSYVQTAGSRYEANVSPQGIDLISVDGTATLQGGTVQARLRAGLFTPSDTYKIISTTSGLNGTYSGITVSNPFVLPTLVYDANNAYIHVQRGFQFAGGTPNQIAVEAALDHGVAGIGAGALPTRDFLSVTGDLLNLEGSSAYAALDQLGAEAYTAFPNAHFEAARLGMDAIDSRLTAARTTGACAAGEATALPANGTRACSWISVLGSTGSTGGYDTWLGQQTSLAGVISGVDYRVAPQFTLGAALVAIHGNTSTDTLPVHGQFDTYQAALYGSYVPGAYWLQATIGYARNDDEMKRSLLFTDTPRTALGNVDGNQYFASLRNGVDLPMAKFGVFTPFVALEMQSVESPAFTETGADSANLAVSGNTANSMRSLLGAQWRKDVDWIGRAWSLNAQLAWAHQYGVQTQAINASFEGAADSDFTVHGSGPARDMAQVGLGARVELGRQIHAFLRYDGEFGGGGHTHAGSAGVDYRW